MKKITIITLVITLITLLCFDANAQRRKLRKKAKKDMLEWRYELECMGIGVSGTYLVKVWSYSRDPQIAIEQAKKNAIHGIIFRGYSGNRENGCVTVAPMVSNPNIEIEKKDFFKDFFADGGKYQKFINLTADGAVAASDRIKISRKEYKIGVVVSVRKDLLRKDLIAAGIIESFESFGF